MNQTDAAVPYKNIDDTVNNAYETMRDTLAGGARKAWDGLRGIVDYTKLVVGYNADAAVRQAGKHLPNVGKGLALGVPALLLSMLPTYGQKSIPFVGANEAEAFTVTETYFGPYQIDLRLTNDSINPIYSFRLTMPEPIDEWTKFLIYESDDWPMQQLDEYTFFTEEQGGPLMPGRFALAQMLYDTTSPASPYYGLDLSDPNVAEQVSVELGVYGEGGDYLGFDLTQAYKLKPESPPSGVPIPGSALLLGSGLLGLIGLGRRIKTSISAHAA